MALVVLSQTILTSISGSCASSVLRGIHGDSYPPDIYYELSNTFPVTVAIVIDSVFFSFI